ncbi:2-oxo-tetronate isomerase [Ferrovibrio sp.]|uniref:2-oxo-tetronate isomerase n=1 Tax=Ferrovibrio sp. TaxID=1917215 RepID=UPI002623B51E|nr:2-oxo-tetronate isomerase [Ferrovibrio sp.]
MPRFAANLSFLFQDLPFLDRFPAAADQGFAAVEFMFPYDHAPAAIAAAMRDAGLQVALFNAPPGDWTAGERGLASLPNRRQEFRAAMARAFDYAAALNCPRIHVVAGVEPARPDRRAMEACYMDNLAWAAEQASGAGLLLLIEPINRRDIPGFFLSDFDVAQKVIEEIGAPNLRLQFDIYHAQIIHGDISRRLERQMPWVGHIQIANPPDRREPGNGEIDYRYIFDRVDALGYDGWVGCEYRPEADTVASLGWIREYGVVPKRR